MRTTPMVWTGLAKRPVALTPSQMSERWPASPPEHLALPPGRWIDPGTAEQLLMSANGVSDRVTAKCWLQAMVRDGLADLRDCDTSVRLLPEEERPGYAAAEARRAHLETLRRDLADLEQQA